MILVLWTLVGSILNNADTSLRCDGRLIQPGFTRSTLEAICGPPGYRVAIPVLSDSIDPISGRRFPAIAYETVEFWTYARDRGSFLRQVELRRGIVAGIRELERVDGTDRKACRRGIFPDRAPIGVVALSCGVPPEIERWSETVPTLYGNRLRNYERWTYDLGRGRFLRVLTFENGRLKELRQAERRR